jgi:hypothetical protein
MIKLGKFFGRKIKKNGEIIINLISLKKNLSNFKSFDTPRREKIIRKTYFT